jgi:hypothetical protein
VLDGVYGQGQKEVIRLEPGVGGAALNAPRLPLLINAKNGGLGRPGRYRHYYGRPPVRGSIRTVPVCLIVKRADQFPDGSNVAKSRVR